MLRAADPALNMRGTVQATITQNKRTFDMGSLELSGKTMSLG
jgi:hypothetical protein